MDKLRRSKSASLGQLTKAAEQPRRRKEQITPPRSVPAAAPSKTTARNVWLGMGALCLTAGALAAGFWGGNTGQAGSLRRMGPKDLKKTGLVPLPRDLQQVDLSTCPPPRHSTRLDCVEDFYTPYCPPTWEPEPCRKTPAAICMIGKDERYTRDWALYHIAMGFGTVYVFDNNSTVPLVEREPYFQYMPEVRVQFFNAYPPNTNAMMAVYQECIDRFADRHEVMGFFDADEYLILPKGHHHVMEVAKNFLAYGGLAVNSRMFGSSNHTTRPGGRVIDNYTQCLPLTDPSCVTVKVIAVSANVLATGDDPHTFAFREGFFAVTERLERVNGPHSKIVSQDKIGINHYAPLSLPDAIEKVQRGGDEGIQTMAFFDAVNEAATEICPTPNWPPNPFVATV